MRNQDALHRIVPSFLVLSFNSDIQIHVNYEYKRVTWRLGYDFYIHDDRVMIRTLSQKRAFLFVTGVE